MYKVIILIYEVVSLVIVLIRVLARCQKSETSKS